MQNAQNNSFFRDDYYYGFSICEVWLIDHVELIVTGGWSCVVWAIVQPHLDSTYPQKEKTCLPTGQWYAYKLQPQKQNFILFLVDK